MNLEGLASMLEQQIDLLLSKKQYITIAIDGRCGAGKSSLASNLAAKYHSTVIHMDDFFLPPALRTRDRLKSPGGNVDYERFLKEVAPLLTNHKNGSYRVFSCSEMEFSHSIDFSPHPLTIVEGSYSMHPNLRFLYDYAIFMDVKPKEQQNRLLHRVGAEALINFQEKWIPMEELYFDYYNIQNVCDIVLDNSSNR